MEIHHDKHHATYTTNLNNAIAGTDLTARTLLRFSRTSIPVPANIKTAVQNNGGGHANHNLFWEILGAQGGGAPSGELASAIDKALVALTPSRKR